MADDLKAFQRGMQIRKPAEVPGGLEAPQDIPQLTDFQRGMQLRQTTPFVEQSQQASLDDPGFLRELSVGILGGSVTTGTGRALQGVGNVVDMLERRVFRDPNAEGAEGLLRAGNWVKRKGEQLKQSNLSNDTVRQMTQSSITGNLIDPNTWDFGQDPTLKGLSFNVLNVFGEMAPIVVAAVVTKSPIAGASVGGAQAGQEGRETAQQEIQEAFDAGVLQMSPQYRALLKEGKTPDEALAEVLEDAGDLGQLLVSPIGAFGGAVTSAVVKRQLARGLAKNIAIEGTQEGVTETLEGVTGRLSAEVAGGIDTDLGKGTFGDFVMGALAGGPVGAINVGGAGGSDPESSANAVEEFDLSDLGVQDIEPVTEESGTFSPVPEVVGDAQNDPTIPPTNTLVTTPESGPVGGNPPLVLNDPLNNHLDPIPSQDGLVKVEEIGVEQEVAGFTVGDFVGQNPEFTYAGPKEGSAPGGLFKDQSGQQYIVKQYKNAEQAQEEKLSLSLLSQVLGDNVVPVPYANEPENAVINEWVDEVEPFDPGNPVHKAAVQDSFIMHAWLANWDVVGQTNDNILIKDGKAIFVDAGGALDFRAQGKKKGLKFTRDVRELDTFVDPKVNPKTAELWSGLTEDQKQEQFETLVETMIMQPGSEHGNFLLDTIIGAQQNGLPVKSATGLYRKLVGRLRNIAEKLELEQPHIENLLGDIPVADHNLLIKTVAEEVTNLKTQMGKEAQDVITEAEIYQHFNDNVNYSYTNDPSVTKVLQDPMLMELQTNPDYLAWVKGNKVWWDSTSAQMVLVDLEAEQITPQEAFEQHGLLPGMLFHGVSTVEAKTSPKGYKYFWDKYDTSFQHKGSSGADSKAGLFLEEDPFRAYLFVSGKMFDANNVFPDEGVTLKDLHNHQIKPLMVNIKDPYIVDHERKQWKPQTNLRYVMEARRLGKDAVIVRNIHDKGTTTTQVIMLEPDGKNIKSPWALEFNPGANDIMMSTAGRKVRVRTLNNRHQKMFEEELDRFGLKGIIDVGTFPFGTAGKTNAVFGKDLKGYYIGMAQPFPSVYGEKATFRHELIHALKRMGFFNSPEGKKYWKVLTAHVKKQGISDHVRGNYDPSNHVEEEVAILAEKWTGGEFQADGLLEKALKSIRDFFEALGNFMKGRGFTTAEQAFQAIFGGSRPLNTWIAATSDEAMYSYETDLKKSVLPGKKVGVDTSTGKADYFGRLTKYGVTVLQLAEKNTHLPWLQRYTQFARLWHGAKTKWLQRANLTVGAWNGLGPTQARRLSGFVLEMDRMTYRSTEEVENGVRRPPTTKEFMGLVKVHKLNEEALKVYVKIRKDFQDVLNKMERVTLESIDRQYGNVVGPTGMGTNPQADIEKAKVRKEFEEIRGGPPDVKVPIPYFPHSRFGTYTVVVTDPSGKRIYVEAFENPKERDKAFEATKKKFAGKQDYAVARGKFSEEQKVYLGLPSALLVAMKNNLKLNKFQMAALDEMIASSLPANSFKNHFVKRDNTAGYSKDALRAYANYFWHGANHLGRIEFAPQMEEEIRNAKADVVALQSTHDADATKRTQIKDFVEDHLNELQNPSEDWAAVRSVGFMWWLGFNVKSALVNLTQLPLVTAAHINAHFGDAAGAVELSKAMLRIQKAYRAPDKVNTPKDKQNARLVQEGINQGFLDESFAAELAGLAEGANITQSVAKNAHRRMLLHLNHAGGYMFQTTEKLNRRVSFMAGVELARKQPDNPYLSEIRKKFSVEIEAMKKRGFSDSETVAFFVGKDVVERTQFNYSAWSRPRVMRGRRSAILTFFMFTQNMFWFIGNNPGKTRYLLTLLLFSGLMGMPGAEDLEEIVKLIGRKVSGKDWNPEIELRKMLSDHFGPDGPEPDLFLNGISRYGFGLPQLGDMVGLPIPSTDLSGNIGMGSPIPVVSPGIQAATKMMGGADFNQALGEFTMEGVGPTLSIPLNIIQASLDTRLPWDDLKRWERAAPAALSSLSKASRFWNEGEDRTRSGATVLEFDQNNPAHVSEIIAQAAGFYPTRRAEAWDEMMALGDAERFWQGRRGTLYNKYDWARRTGDKEMMRDVLGSVNRYNKAVPYGAMRLSRSDLEKSYKQRELARIRKTRRIPSSKKYRQLFQELRDVFEVQEKAPRGD